MAAQPPTPELEQKIHALLDAHRLMSLATLRADGWPQATTVGYMNDGLQIYFLCGRESQKAENLARDPRVSLTIDHDTNDVMAIEGLSMAARARPVDDAAEVEQALRRLAQKYPEYAAMPNPDLSSIRIYRVEPEIISVLDYSKGFGHTDLVAMTRQA